jgi:DNA repair protein RecO (recombination protein O)
LHRTNLGEADRIVTLYTREQGKIPAIARGARRPKSRFAGATELFTESRFLLATGKTLDVVTQSEILASFPPLRADLERLARATYFCELLDRLTPERDATACAALFDLTLGALQLLQRAETYPDAIVHAYELHLLDAVGYAPSLEYCARCGNLVEARRGFGFSASQGGVLCPLDRHAVQDAFALSPDALRLLRVLSSENSETLLLLRPDFKAAAEVARALRWYVRFRSERDLKSASFLDQIRAAQRAQAT